MANWTSGYVDEITYMHGFYRQLTPSMMSFSALANGQKFDVEAPDLTYCELGCGQGFSANLLAAANPRMQFHAMDFNPAHIVNARRLAAEAKLANVRFYDSAFADFPAEPALPEGFDIIALHGVYSWISEENRRHIVDFAARRLKPGGLFYLSYNAMPGWAITLPLRRLLVDRASKTAGPIGPRIDEALAFVQSVAKADASYFKLHGAAGVRLKTLTTMSRSYLAHEYFNRDWTPFYFEDVARELAEAKLTYVGSLNLIDHMDELSLTEEQHELLGTETDPVRREAIRDFLVNQLFRADMFGKGTASHTERSAAGVWLQTRFALSTEAEKVPLVARARLKDVKLPEDLYRPLLDAFSGGPRTVRDILTANATPGLSWGQVIHGLTVLVGAGHLQPCLGEAAQTERAEHCKAFNRAVCKTAEDNEDYQFLASPVTGGGLAVTRAERLFMLAISDGKEGPAAWAQFTWEILAPQGQRLLKDGKMLETDAENIAELMARARDFARFRLPIFNALQVTC